MSMSKHRVFLLGLITAARLCSSFVFFRRRIPVELFGSTEQDVIVPSIETLQDLKDELICLCVLSPKPKDSDIQEVVERFENVAENMGVGQASSTSGLLNGDWELIYCPEDVTRSSPFFWAFEQAFPQSASQVFAITDAIPPPFKDVGPAVQKVSMDENICGTLVSRVKVATLSGQATSMMTTTAKIVGGRGVDGIELQVQTTQPEDSTLVQKLLGPFSSLLNGSLPPFPSGDALERVMPGSSTVVMITTFCDETLRISRNSKKRDGVFVWRRRSFDVVDSQI